MQARQALQKNDHLIGAVLADVPPRVKCYLNARMAVTELLPPLLEIIAPNLRPVSCVVVRLTSITEVSDTTIDKQHNIVCMCYYSL